MFSSADFTRLAKVEGDSTVSIYVPTHRAGQQTHNGHDRIVFKDAVKEVRHQLETAGQYKGESLDAYLKPLTDLTEDQSFWRHQSDTLAAFLTDDGLQTFALPIETTETKVQVGGQLHLTPAAAMLQPEARYYIFTMALGSNAFYEATRHSITPVYIHDEVPKDVEEVMELYVGGETLQGHSGGKTGDGMIYSGQGSNEDRRDEEKQIYYERVTAGLDKLLAGQQEPLILVCDAQYATEFKRTFQYPHVFADSLDINPSDLSPAELHTETWKMIEPHFDKSSSELKQQYSDAIGAKTYANGVYDVIPAAINGQIATLMINNEQATIYGEYDADNNAVKFHDERQDDSQDLIEFAIRKTVENGGKVVVREQTLLPEGVEGVAATLRYAV